MNKSFTIFYFFKLKLYDSNQDGKLQLSEMIKLLSPKENNALKIVLKVNFSQFSFFLKIYVLLNNSNKIAYKKTCSTIKNDDLDKIFDAYDSVNIFSNNLA
jgi:hypothetical protein